MLPMPAARVTAAPSCRSSSNRSGVKWDNQLENLSELTNVPVTNLLLILVGMPLAAAVAGWLLAGREPDAMARQPIE